MQRILLATTNKGKQREYAELLAPLAMEVTILSDLGPDVPEVVEDGLTFEENALKKALTYFRHFQLPVIADDSGLEVDALGGKPGVFSARYAGEKASDEENIAKLLAELHNVPLEKRSARFVCVIAYVDGKNDPIIAKGFCSGQIAFEPKGSNGFGYDPIFYLPQYEKTMAQLEPEEKNKISHRSKALEQFVQLLKQDKVDSR